MKTVFLFALKKSGKGNPPNPEKKQNTSTNKTTILVNYSAESLKLSVTI